MSNSLSFDEALLKKKLKDKKILKAETYKKDYASELKYMLGKKNSYTLTQTESIQEGYISNLIDNIIRNLAEYGYKRKVFVWFEKKLDRKYNTSYLVLVIKIGRCVNRINLLELMLELELGSYLEVVRIISESDYVIDEYRLNID